MVLNVIGCGLFGYYSITTRGLDVIKKPGSKVFTFRTCKHICDVFQAHRILVSVLDDGDLMHSHCPLYALLENDLVDASVLVEGDFTYRNLIKYLNKFAAIKKFTIKIINNASILNAVGCTGLQLYKFGGSIQIQKHFTKEESPDVLKLIEKNRRKNLHTLLYYDCISAASNKKTDKFFMNLVNYMRMAKRDFISDDTVCATLASENNKIVTRKTSFAGLSVDSSTPSFAFVISGGALHPMEKETLVKLSSMKRLQVTEDTHTLYLIGLGLESLDDITVGAKEAIQMSRKVYLESCTSRLLIDAEDLSQYHNKKVITVDREMVEQNIEKIIMQLEFVHISFLVVGDPLSATTHADLVVRVIDAGHKVEIISNLSIINASFICGLLPDNFGEIVSIPFWEENWKPESFFDKICSNLESGWHTLCLLDLQVKEIPLDKLVRGKKEYAPPRYMIVSEAVTQLLQIIASREKPEALKGKTKVIGLCRVATKTEKIVRSCLDEIVSINLGDPLHSLIICAEGVL